jgi:hypothetical protein
MRTDKPTPLLWFIASVLALFVLGVALAFAATDSKTPVWRLVALVLAMQLPYSVALFAAWRMRHRLDAGWLIAAISLVFRLVLVAAPATFSDDLFRYIWDGQVLGAGINPYHFSPEALELAWLRGPHWNQINHPALGTIYPPVAQAIFWVVASMQANPTAFKLASALADTVVVCLVILLGGGRLARSRQSGERDKACRAAFFGLVYGLNPLACIETGMSGHLEPFAVGLLLLALFFAGKKRRSIAAFFLGLGAGVKLIPVLLLPAVARRRLVAWLICPLVVVAVYLPFVSAGTGTVETLDAFARRWEGNGGLFAALKFGVQSGVCAVSGAEGKDAMVHVQGMDPVARSFQGTFFSLHKDGAYDPSVPGAFTVGDISLAVSKMIVGLGLIFIIVAMVYRRVDEVTSAVWIFGALVVVTPILHPWYLLWVLPLAAVRSVWPFYVLAAVIPLAYLPLDGWWSRGVWALPPWVPWLENGLFLLAFIVYAASKRGNIVSKKQTVTGIMS